MVVGLAPAGLVDPESGLSEPPVSPLVAFDLADLLHHLGGGLVVAGLDGQVEQRQPDLEVVRPQGRELGKVLPRQRRLAEPDLRHGQPVEKRGAVGGGDLLRRLCQPGHRSLGGIVTLQPPVVQPCQLDGQARAQVLFRLVEDLQ